MKNKIKVQVVIAIDINGEWSCDGLSSGLNGGKERSLQESAEIAAEGLSEPHTIYYFHAEIELPQRPRARKLKQGTI